MFRRVEVRHYKLLRRVDVRLAPMNILVGPNASGKSTLLDVFAFLQTALNNDIETAVRARTMGNALYELVSGQSQDDQDIEFALEIDIPQGLNKDHQYIAARYELAVGIQQNELAIKAENFFLMRRFDPPDQRSPSLFPIEMADKTKIVRPIKSHTPKDHTKIISKGREGASNFQSEITDWTTAFRLPPLRLSLSGVPEDQTRFPAALWFKNVLTEKIQILQLNSVLMRRPTPSDARRTFQVDGSNLPMVVSGLKKESPENFAWWIAHLQTILPDLMSVDVAERPENRSLYLEVIYRGDLRVPAWLLSDGTLRLLALTLIAYLPHEDRIFMIEEPENGVHPRAIEGIFESLSSVYNGQIFLATHSPLLLSLAQPDQMLVFAKTSTGGAAVVRGSQHPLLENWRRDISLGTLFASGVFG
jgi:predicted ATPase